GTFTYDYFGTFDGIFDDEECTQIEQELTENYRNFYQGLLDTNAVSAEGTYVFSEGLLNTYILGVSSLVDEEVEFDEDATSFTLDGDKYVKQK
ncbi:MAG: hypothetical protein KBS81_01310, partial [Spirochaetales bacterium]|nr:hypothetical protein [Candidatus Physcosoma equi]